MWKNFILISIVISATGCGSGSKKSDEENKKEIASKPTLIELKKKCLPEKIRPAKGKFLEYIYKIQPDHKQPGYSINTFWLGNGYAYGEGPYDGYLLEFFLFRGKPRDLVLVQKSGYESTENRKFGYTITPYFFANGKMDEAKLEEVFPVKLIEQLFTNQTEKFKASAAFQKRKESWSFFNLIRLPLSGTTIEFKICRDAQENPFLTDSPCALIGHMRWGKSKFILEKNTSFAIENEKY